MIPSELLGVVILPKNCIMLFVSEFSCGSLRILRSGKEYNAHITHKGESIMRDRIISNVLIKMGNRIKKKELEQFKEAKRYVPCDADRRKQVKSND